MGPGEPQLPRGFGMERTITAAFTGHDLVDLVNSIALRQDEYDLDVVSGGLVSGGRDVPSASISEPRSSRLISLRSAQGAFVVFSPGDFGCWADNGYIKVGV